MAKRKLLSKVGCLVAAGGLVAGCGVETLKESDVQPVSEVRQAIANGMRFNVLAEPAGVGPRADLQVYRRSDNTWWARRTYDGVGTGYTLNRTPAAEDVPVQGNFDGDALYDQATFRPSTGVWLIRRSSDGAQYTVHYGQNGDIPTPGDFDGDGRTDVSVWRPSSGTFFVTYSSGGSVATQYGQSGDIPVVGDYDGNGRDDFAVWRPCTGIWYYGSNARQWGTSGDIPVPGDYDGDGKTDIAVFRPSSGTWFIIRSSTNAGSATPYGAPKDYPVPADYDGDGKTDIAFLRPSEGKHYMIYSSTALGTFMDWATAGDMPANTNVYCTGGGGVQPCNSDNVNSPVCGASTSIAITADNTYDLYLNGTRIGGDSNASASGWQSVESYSVTTSSGDVVAVKGVDDGINAGILASITRNGVTYNSGSSWKCTTTLYSGWNSKSFSDAAWAQATQYGANGVQPWGTLSGMNASAQWIWTNDKLNHNVAYCRFTLP